MKLEQYRADFDLSYDQFIVKHSVRESQIDENVRYEKISDVYRVKLDDGLFYYFKGDTLKVIYFSGGTLAQTVWDEFSNGMAATPDETVRSRAGKTSNQLIFAREGIAVSIRKNEVDFLEIFPPCSLQEYLDNIYSKPQVFIR